jgi:dipeptidyl aminopeptidase/acylaminoacyl peptidase
MTILPRFAAAALTALILAGSASAAAAQQAPAPGDYTVRFLDRTVDLQPFFQGFPYNGWDADYDAGRLFYFHDTPRGRFLMSQPLRSGAGVVDPAAGTRLHDIDWSRRNFSGMRFHAPTGDMILQADERNDEVFNLYRLSLRDGSLRRLTDVPYIYGWDFSKDDARIGYLARHGDGEPYRTCLMVLELAGGGEREVLCEHGGEHRLVWSLVNWRPDGSGVVLKVNRDGHRRQGTLAYVDLTAAAPRLEILLPDGVERFALSAQREWLDNDRFYYVSDETGFSNLYEYDLARRAARPVTRVEEQASFTQVEVDGRRLIQVRYTSPRGTTLAVVDPATGAELGRRDFVENVGFVGFDRKNRFVFSLVSPTSPYRADEAVLTLRDGRPEWRLQPKIRLPEAMTAAIEHCDVERIEYPTFDVDPATGTFRRLHAFLMTPRRPLENPAERLAVITAFYGGGNNFDTRAQIYCAAGISWLSPAVRGSGGFGAAFAALNDDDLGGDEIVDLFHAARYLEGKLGLKPAQIGVAGGSHGGYATMRALTFPPHTNARDDSYDFGFGMSHAGFSSILTFYDDTNIPDWIILEAGDPRTEREKLLDRSPLTHVERLRAPLLLTHGGNDNRVGVNESRQFYAVAKELGKPVRYIEYPGQGHSIRGLENVVSYYRAQFEFLEGVVRGAAAAATN